MGEPGQPFYLQSLQAYNKRATMLYIMRKYEASVGDCKQVGDGNGVAGLCPAIANTSQTGLFPLHA